MIAPEIQQALDGDYSAINRLELDNFPGKIQYKTQEYCTDNVSFTARFNEFGRIIGWTASVYDPEDTEKDCENCQGSGEITTTVRGREKSYDAELDCPDCDGSGKTQAVMGSLVMILPETSQHYCCQFSLDLTGEILYTDPASDTNFDYLIRN